MAETLSMALAELLRKADAEPDLDTLREGVRVMTQALMELEVAQHLGAERYQRSPERHGERNGYRDRNWDTRVGTLPLPQARRHLSIYLVGRHVSESEAGPPGGEHGGGDRRGPQCGHWPAGGPGRGRRPERGWGLLAALLTRPGGAWPGRCATGHQRQPPGPQGSHRRRAPRRQLATLPHAFHEKRPVSGTQGHPADGRRDDPHGV